METLGFVITLVTGICMNAECSVCNVHLTREYLSTEKETKVRLEDMLTAAAELVQTSPLNFGSSKVVLDNGLVSVNLVAMIDPPCYTEATQLSRDVVEVYNRIFPGEIK